MESKVTKLAAELVRRLHAPRILDYATPGLRPPFMPWWLTGERCCAGTEVLGFGLVIVSFVFPLGLAGLLLLIAGVIVVLAARVWRLSLHLSR